MIALAQPDIRHRQVYRSILDLELAPDLPVIIHFQGDVAVGHKTRERRRTLTQRHREATVSSLKCKAEASRQIG